jgi:hypothetical protein
MVLVGLDGAFPLTGHDPEATLRIELDGDMRVVRRSTTDPVATSRLTNPRMTLTSAWSAPGISRDRQQLATSVVDQAWEHRTGPCGAARRRCL